MSSARPATLRVAALQLNSASGDVGGNLARAVAHVEAAAAAGAQLVLLPELYSSGFAFDRSLWAAAERLEDGPTRRWLCALASRLGVHLGTSVLEARGAHFFNTFLLAQPDGALAGVVRKQTPAALEAFFFAPGQPRGADAHVIPCPLLGGLRVGVGICYENAMEYLARHAAEAHFDVLLMPHSAPRVERVPAAVAEAYDQVLAAMPRRYALALRIPVVMANKSGPWSSTFLGLGGRVVFTAGFAGLSQVVDSDGTVLAPPSRGENVVLCATVRVPPPGAAAALPRRAPWRKFSELAPHPLTLRAIFTADEWLGALVYRCSGERRRAALAASGGDADVMVPANYRAAAVAGVVGLVAAVLYARLSAD